MAKVDTKCSALLLEAQREAKRLGNPDVEPEHVLLADLSHGDGVIADLSRSNFLGESSIDEVRSIVELRANELPRGKPRQEARSASKRLLKCLSSAGESHGDITWNRLVVSTLNIRTAIPDDPLGYALFKFRIEPSIPDESARQEDRAGTGKVVSGDGGDFLAKYCIDLTSLAAEGKLVDAIGRGWEIENMILTLRMKSNNNPLLIGDPGVGKTQIVESLAKKIHEGSAGNRLNGVRIYRLDVGALTSGTQFRGAFEERLRGIVRAIKEQKGKAILFIDEIHLFLGAGKTEGSTGAADLIKPELARGELPLIGATTYAEFRRYFEKDEAFRSRFNEITIEEPSELEMLDILRGGAPQYSAHHGVELSEAALATIVALSKRYLTEECFPRKAFKVLDKVCAAVAHSKDKCERESAEAVVDDVVHEVSARTGIPKDVLQSSVSERLLGLGEALRASIIGQGAAIEAIVSKLQLLSLPQDNKGRPRGIFLFAGPSGVGKTETARILARELYGSEKNFLKLNMAEYTESHSAARLLGADPGTVGYEQGGVLTEPIRRRPYSLVLLDEIEKAHPSVCKVFLNVLDDGRVRDSQGHVVDFSNCILILTSNLGYSTVEEVPSGEAEIKKLLANNLGNEFVGRIQTTIPFRYLTAEDVEQIISLTITSYKQRFAQTKPGLKINITQEAKKFIGEKGYQKDLGARSVMAYMDRNVLEQVAQRILTKRQENQDYEPMIVRVSLREGQEVAVGMEYNSSE